MSKTKHDEEMIAGIADAIEKENPIQSALAAGAGLAEPDALTLPGGRIGYIIPKGFEIAQFEPVNGQLPDHVQATPKFEDTASFIEYVNRFKGKETAIFASLEKNTMQAVIDYHAASGGKVSRPDRCRHTASHDFPFSVPWQRWREIDGQLMTQAELGLFLEEMLYTIAAPAGAGLLELASELRIDRQVKFKSGTRLQSGANSLAYEEEDETSGRSGKMEVPDAVTIACPVFMGGARRTFEAKLRYRLNRGDIKFAIAVINRLEGEQAAFAEAVEGVGSATGCPVFMGHR